MNWIEKIAQSKPMPLPFSTDDESGGTQWIDREMSQQTADQLKEQYPGINFLGGGGVGVAGEHGGNAIKFTLDFQEASLAEELMKKNLSCIVDVYSVKQVQEEAHGKVAVWAIESEKVDTNLTKEQKDLGGNINADLKYGTYSRWGVNSPIPSSITEQGWEAVKQYFYEKYTKQYPHEQQFITDYLEMRTCIENSNLITQDAHGDNVGYNKKGKLVLFDLGYSEFEEREEPNELVTASWLRKAMPDKPKAIMNWLQKIAQSKPMALPFARPNDSGYGLKRIDQRMTEETAREQRQNKKPKYRGAGQAGVAVDLGNGLIGKYTDDQEEADFAQHIKSHPVPCIVRVYDVEEVQKQLTDPINSTRQQPIWMIVEDEAKTLSRGEKSIVNYWEDLESGHNLEKIVIMLNQQYSHMTDFVSKLSDFKQCIKQNGIIADDIIGDNVGYDKNGNLILIDLGSTST